MKTMWIDTAKGLQAFCGVLQQADVIGVDTESDHFHAYQARVCLIQVATPEVAALIDPLALDEEVLAPLFEIFRDERVVKIIHSANSDLNELSRDYGIVVRNVFDTQVAARLLGYERHGLSWLLEELLGVKAGKQFQRFDWTQRPIPADAQLYALGDVVDLFALRERFARELAAAGLAEMFAQQCAWVAETSVYREVPFDAGRWRRIKVRRELRGRDRAAMQELFVWRHEMCKALNRAAILVFDNAALEKVARARPRSVKEYEALGIRAHLTKDQVKGLLAAVRRSLDMPIPPEYAPRVGQDMMSSAQKKVLAELKAWRDGVAAELGIPFEFVGANSIWGEVVEHRPGNVEELGKVRGILPWVQDKYGEEIVAIVNKKL